MQAKSMQREHSLTSPHHVSLYTDSLTHSLPPSHSERPTSLSRRYSPP